MNDREKFEAWFDKHNLIAGRSGTCTFALDDAGEYMDCDVFLAYRVWKACAESKKSETNSLQIENALYASDAKRCWEMMPELKNNDAAYELHEAVQIKIVELANANKEIERCTESYKLAYIRATGNAEAYGIVRAELDKANERIAQLEEACKMAYSMYACEGRYGSSRLMEKVVEKSSDTWLLEHDKAVEVRVLEEADRRCINLPESADTVMDCSEILCLMIESRK